YVEVTADDVVLLMAPLTFDASTFEIWGALLKGASLAIYPDGPFDIARLKQVIATAKVSVLWLTAAVFHHVVGEDLTAIAGVETLLAGGGGGSGPGHGHTVGGCNCGRLTERCWPQA